MDNCMSEILKSLDLQKSIPQINIPHIHMPHIDIPQWDINKWRGWSRMNRLILIGNGFDMAHGLHTSYPDFLRWYWKLRMDELCKTGNRISRDNLCELKLYSHSRYSSWANLIEQNITFQNMTWEERLDYIKRSKDECQYNPSALLRRIDTDFEHKGWVDIEESYYKLLVYYVMESNISKDAAHKAVINLDQQLAELQVYLIKYLRTMPLSSDLRSISIMEQIYSPIKRNEVTVKQRNNYDEYLQYLIKGRKESLIKFLSPYITSDFDIDSVLAASKALQEGDVAEANARFSPKEYEKIAFPTHTMLLSFNYTDIVQLYAPDLELATINYIHGKLDDPKTIIFGYGDEIDGSFKKIQNENDNTYLKNVKSIRYLEDNSYQNLLQFIESAPFQVCIMGHSCGISDRTLLNTIFEHENCVSVKPYFYKKDDGSDDYINIVQNISRNFSNMKKMRERVVNKTNCTPLGCMKSQLDCLVSDLTP